MALRSILDLEVNTGQFDSFRAKYDEYNASLKRSPAAWREVTNRIGDASRMIAGMSKAGDPGVQMMHRMAAAGQEAAKAAVAVDAAFVASGSKAAAISRETQKAAVSQHQAARDARAQAASWEGLARTSKAFAGHILDATRSLLKWSTVTGAVSGLLGAGGLFGIERLASAAGAGRRAALGLGTTFGEQRAFSVNYGRLVDPNQFLGGVNQALHDVTRRYTLYGAGLTEADLRGKDTAQVGGELITSLKRLADQTPDAMLAQTLKARGLDQFISLQDFQRLKATPAAEVNAYGQQFQQDVARLNLTRQQLKAWQDLQVQLTRAGQGIEVNLIRALTPLAPELARLSEAFGKTVQTFLESPVIRHWIDELAAGLNWLAEQMKSPSFQHDVELFAQDVKQIAIGLGQFLEAVAAIGEKLWGWIGGKPAAGGAGGGGAAAPNPARQRFEQKANTPGTPEYRSTHTGGAGWGYGSGFGWYWSPGAKNEPNPITGEMLAGSGRERPTGRPAAPWPIAPGAPGGPIAWPPSLGWNKGTAAQRESLRQIEKSNFLPQGMLDAVWNAESGRAGSGGHIRSSAGAEGPFQFMPDTARGLGITNPDDFGQASQGAGRYLRDLMGEFGGDPWKALAAYNWGPQNVERDIQQYGADWRAHLPAETTAYLASILGTLQAQQPARQPSAPSPAPAAAPASWNASQQKPRDVTIRVDNQTGGAAAVSASQLAV